jgi:hypothetical protein
MPKRKAPSLAPKLAPKLARVPWAQFTPDDFPREHSLSQCPSPKCRRIAQCVAPHAGLYCQRTHMTKAEGKWHKAKTKLARDIANLPAPPQRAPMAERMEHLAEVAHVKKLYTDAEIKLWRAGGLPQKFGKYKSAGIMLKPPPRSYADHTSS